MEKMLVIGRKSERRNSENGERHRGIKRKCWREGGKRREIKHIEDGEERKREVKKW